MATGRRAGPRLRHEGTTMRAAGGAICRLQDIFLLRDAQHADMHKLRELRAMIFSLRGALRLADGMGALHALLPMMPLRTTPTPSVDFHDTFLMHY